MWPSLVLNSSRTTLLYTVHYITLVSILAAWLWNAKDKVWKATNGHRRSSLADDLGVLIATMHTITSLALLAISFTFTLV